MSTELIAVLIGGALAILGGFATTLSFNVVENRRRAKSIRSLAAAEVTAIAEKAQRYVNGDSTFEELSASTPLLTTIASELGYLSPKQIIAFRRALTLDMEMRKRKGENRAKALFTIDACKEALKFIRYQDMISTTERP